MKRSKMLGDIYDILYINTDLDDDLVSDLSIMILNKAEENGMKPPNYEGLMRSGELFVREKHQGSDTVLFNGKWEPEDEEK